MLFGIRFRCALLLILLITTFTNAANLNDLSTQVTINTKPSLQVCALLNQSQEQDKILTLRLYALLSEQQKLTIIGDERLQNNQLIENKHGMSSGFLSRCLIQFRTLVINEHVSYRCAYSFLEK